MSLLEKLMNKQTKVFTKDRTGKVEFVPTDIPALNIALSGDIDGGLTSGFLIISGLSKTYKTMMSLKMVSAYLKKYDDAVCVFYDSEFGVTENYIKTFGIDPARMLHVETENIEQLKFDFVEKVNKIEKGEHVIFLIDSLGNLASKKEVEDAIDAKSVADMTRAKALRSLFRIITPILSIKNLPCIAISHVYNEMGLYPKTVVSGGTAIQYASNNVWIVTKAMDKDGTELEGFIFTINIDKSRFVKEKSKIPLTVSFETGIQKYSGILDFALESGHIIKPKNGWYQLKTDESKNYREKDLDPILEQLVNDQSFKDWICTRFKYKVFEENS